jgi:hypothetical protein
MSCKGFKKNNESCTRKCVEGTDYCWQHGEKTETKNENALLVCFANSCSLGNSTNSSSNKSKSFNLRFDEIYYDPKKQNHIKSRSTYLGNQLIKIETYWKNGNILSEQNFKNNKLDGSEFTFYENGKKRSEYNYINGQKNGEQIEWYSNGNVRSDETYENGKLLSNGKSKVGTKKHEAEFDYVEDVIKNGDIEDAEGEELNESETEEEYGFDEEERDEENEQEEEDY